jgi:hypothetical protein
MTPRKNRKDRLMELIKLEVAEELGLLDKIQTKGWGALNAAEAGQIGGRLASRLKDAGLQQK